MLLGETLQDGRTVKAAPDDGSVKSQLTPWSKRTPWFKVGYVVAVAVTVGYVVIGYGYGIGSLALPGPGMFPVAAGMVTLLGLVLLAFQRADPAAHPDHSKAAEPPPGGAFRAAIVVVLLVGFALLVPIVKDVVAGIGLALGILLVSKMRPWLAVPLAVVISLAVHMVFVVLLGVPINNGTGLL